MRFLTLGLLVVVAAGCDKTHQIKIIDAGPECGENEHLVNGTCRFVCNRDGDCQTGERCNLLFGTCEPKPPPTDAGPDLIPCTEGAVRCSADGTALQTCSDAGVFEVSQLCPQPDGFCENEQCLSCRPGTRRCGTDTTTAEVCLDDGSAFRTITCAATASCVAGECDECVLGTRRCNGPDVEECERTTDETRATAYTPAGDNFDGTCITQQCETGANGPQCHPPTCIPGALACASSAVQQTCSATGSWVQTDCVTSLASPTAQCISGNCIDECGDAAAAKSYFGCEYWTAVEDNEVGLSTAVDNAFKGGLTTTGQGTQDSEFAFVIANNSVQTTTVDVKRFFNNAEQTVRSVTVPGKTDPTTHGVLTVRVPWHAMEKPLSQGVGVSGRARFAYHIVTNRPVTVYQFNPLGAYVATGSCNNSNQCTLATDGTCVNNQCRYNSYSNDASLLLPAHILGTSYVGLTPEVVAARPSNDSSTPGLAGNGTLTIVATQPTQVTVKVSAATRAGTTGSVAALASGATQTFNLVAYEVLQLSSALPATATNLECGTNPFTTSALCNSIFDSSPCRFCRLQNADLTGTIITADKPIAVFGGSSCALRGYLDTACDHVEEQLFPFQTWGKNFVGTRTAPLRLTNNQFASAANAGPDYYKVVAGCGDTVSTACPNGTAGTTLTLSSVPAAGDVLSGGGCEPGTTLTGTGSTRCRLRAGKFVEFRSKTSFTINADQPIQVAQTFAGQNATTGSTRPNQGDPSQVLLPPVEQWRASYTVLTAPGILDNYLGIVIDDSKVQEVRVDGNPVTAGWTTVNTTQFKVNNVAVNVGSHTVQVVAKPGQQQIPGAGITVYGFDSYVSYGYTGGLDLQSLVTGVNPGG